MLFICRCGCNGSERMAGPAAPRASAPDRRFLSSPIGASARLMVQLDLSPGREFLVTKEETIPQHIGDSIS